MKIGDLKRGNDLQADIAELRRLEDDAESLWDLGKNCSLFVGVSGETFVSLTLVQEFAKLVQNWANSKAEELEKEFKEL